MAGGATNTKASKEPMAIKRVPIGKVVAQAVGNHEAAGIMGVHHSIPQRMHDRGWITGRETKTAGNRRYTIYDGADCEANYREYEEKVDARGGKNDRRPRAWLQNRPTTLRFLAMVKTPIAFDDAIGVSEAAEILGVHPTFVSRLIKSGRVVGRLTMGRQSRASGARVWLVSRRSCIANAKSVRAAEADGTKIGRRRKKS